MSELDLAVAYGDTVAILGVSGAGKSTLLSILGLFLPPDSGEYFLNGVAVGTLGSRALADRRNRDIGFVFQSYSLLMDLTVAENVEVPLLYGEALGRVERRTRVEKALQDVGLSGFGRSHPAELSGGEQQRVAIARALVRDPGIILADEPTGALDGDTGDSVLEVLHACVQNSGACLVLVTHDETVAARMDRVLRLDSGRLGPAVGRESTVR